MELPPDFSEEWKKIGSKRSKFENLGFCPIRCILTAEVVKICVLEDILSIEVIKTLVLDNILSVKFMSVFISAFDR